MKWFGGLLMWLLGLTLLGAIGYNTWQVMLLRSEVRALRQRNSAPKAGIGTSLSRLAEAKRHAERAQALLKSRKFAAARAEMARAAEATQKASGVFASGPDPRASLAELQQAVQSLRDQAGELWDISVPSGTKRPASEKGKKP